MLHIDLFSGIGGFAYAIDQVWDGVEHVFCDNDAFCREVLKKHWPESEIFDDVKSITDTRRERRQQGADKTIQSEGQEPKPANISQLSRIDILTGGFPCQPFSAAGLRRGTADDRYLWPQMLEVIRFTKPEWVIAENVGGLVNWNDGLVLETVCIDLEAAGYEVQPFIIPAVAVDAPHRRDRIWFVAKYTERDGQSASTRTRSANAAAQQEPSRQDELIDTARTDSLPDDTNGQHTGLEGWGKESPRHNRQSGGNGGYQKPDWDKDWTEVATEFCSVDDGLPVELDGFKLSKSQHRKEQLKAYGNAIVPQVAMEIMLAIRATLKP